MQQLALNSMLNYAPIMQTMRGIMRLGALIWRLTGGSAALRRAEAVGYGTSWILKNWPVSERVNSLVMVLAAAVKGAPMAEKLGRSSEDSSW
jgi:hypothetical protein